MATTEARRAQAAVTYAVRSGKLPRPSGLPCDGCGGGAVLYHHHKGYAPAHQLDVVPLCAGCHRRGHAEEQRPPPADRTRYQSISVEEFFSGLLSLREASALTAVPRVTLNRAILTGRLPAKLVGDRWLVTEDAVRAWIAAAPHRPGLAPGTPRAPRKKQQGEGDAT